MKYESEKKMLQLQQQLMFLRWRKCQTGYEEDPCRLETFQEHGRVSTCPEHKLD